MAHLLGGRRGNRVAGGFGEAGFRTRLPEKAAGQGLKPTSNDERKHPLAMPKHDGGMYCPASARAVSAVAQSRFHGVEERARRLSAQRPDRN
jgi:hypothetical protein